jgi:tRNA pseudouridine32 synthase/23S rRNA pseudouridine746 synthase
LVILFHDHVLLTDRQATVIEFSPQPSSGDCPTRFPTPFDRAAVHPLARRAAAELMETLQSRDAAHWRLREAGNGKMFGVLVVAAGDGTIGYLRGFSGMVHGTWDIDGWAPPTFDRHAYDGVRIPAEAEMMGFKAQRAALLATVSNGASPANMHRVNTAVRALDAARAARSRALTTRLHDSYRFENAHGEVRSLRLLFAPGEPPTGSGDCAAPKLLAHAYRLGARPIALAEFWWGATSATGDRREGVYYAACRGKCLPILTHMLDGLPVEPPPLFGIAAIDPAEPRAVFEDEHLLVVEKPTGLLTVPGRSASLSDCVVSRLRRRYPHATGPLAVHRLDLDTSGLLLVAKHADAAKALQRMFSLREIEKHYVAWVNGNVVADHGHITLPLRVDVDDRPRHIHDPVFGKPAHTEWHVLARQNGRTCVRFNAHTGRSHQLRVHSAHPQGLDAPIAGDRLYGHNPPSEDERMLLHAERLAFVHPVSGKRLVIEQSAPF